MADMHLLGDIGGGEVHHDPLPGSYVRGTHSLNAVRIIFINYILETSVADPKLSISDPDPTWRVITDPDPTWRYRSFRIRIRFRN